MTECVLLRPKSYSYLIDDDTVYKKTKVSNKKVIEKLLEHNHNKYCLFNDQAILKPQLRFRSETHNVYTVEIDEIALSSNNKGLQTFDRIKPYP